MGTTHFDKISVNGLVVGDDGIKDTDGNVIVGIDNLADNGALAAAGSTQGNAAAVVANTTFVSAANGTKGVKLPTATAGLACTVVNTVADQTLKVYPATNAAINAAAANAAVVVPAGTAVMFVASSATQWYANLIPAGITATAAELNNAANIGDLSTLTTTEKGSIVGAIIEVEANALASFPTLYAGDRDDLTTTEKGTLVGAINELVTRVAALESA